MSATEVTEATETTQHCSPENIAVLITDMNLDPVEIRKYLNKNGKMCGSIAEQVKNPNLVAVSYAEDALSYDWPFVIVLKSHSGNAKSSSFLIAASRAIAKLIVFDRDPPYHCTYMDKIKDEMNDINNFG